MIADDIRKLADYSAGGKIPKPEAKGAFCIKGMGMRRGEEALIYTIPSHTGRKPYEKGITITEFSVAQTELNRTGMLTRTWFNENLPACSKEGGCNFTSIGGVFEMLGLASYGNRGNYVARGN